MPVNRFGREANIRKNIAESCRTGMCIRTDAISLF